MNEQTADEGRPIEPLGWAKSHGADEVKEIQRLAELQLEDVREIALSNDTRAASIAAAMGAVSAALCAAAAAVMAVPGHNATSIKLLVASVILFAIAAGFALWACSPAQFTTRGFHPRLLSSQNVDETTLRKWAVSNAAWKIDNNARVLKKSARLLRVAFVIAGIGVAVPAIGMLLILQPVGSAQEQEESLRDEKPSDVPGTGQHTAEPNAANSTLKPIKAADITDKKET